MRERTLVVVKPDGVSRGLVGEVISRFERRGFELKALKVHRLTRAEAEEFYSPHKGKPFFEELIEFITSGPVVAIVVEGNEAIEVARSMIGPTKAYEAPPGTIRGDFGLGLTENVVHASDSRESYEREVRVFFEEREIP